MLELTRKKKLRAGRELTLFGKFVKMLAIATAVVFFWRGAWGIADVLLLPNNYFLSSIASLIIGLIILGLTHSAFKELI